VSERVCGGLPPLGAEIASGPRQQHAANSTTDSPHIANQAAVVMTAATTIPLASPV